MGESDVAGEDAEGNMAESGIGYRDADDVGVVGGLTVDGLLFDGVRELETNRLVDSKIARRRDVSEAPGPASRVARALG